MNSHKNIFWFYKAQKAAWLFTVERLSYIVKCTCFVLPLC